MRLSVAATTGCLLVAGCLSAGLFAQAQRTPAATPNLSGIFNGRRCVPANSDVCPEMNVKGGERLLTARGKAFVAAFDEVAAPNFQGGIGVMWFASGGKPATVAVIIRPYE